jgi:hypothetical protein
MKQLTFISIENPSQQFLMGGLGCSKVQNAIMNPRREGTGGMFRFGGGRIQVISRLR